MFAGGGMLSVSVQSTRRNQKSESRVKCNICRQRIASLPFTTAFNSKLLQIVWGNLIISMGAVPQPFKSDQAFPAARIS